MPPHIIVFLATNITKLRELEKSRLVPWPKFKTKFDHRIEFAVDINGEINNSYMPMDEHLVTYFVYKFDSINPERITKGYVGTKEQIQTKLLEFILNLRYYFNRRLRAKTNAEMLGFYVDGNHLGAFNLRTGANAKIRGA